MAGCLQSVQFSILFWWLTDSLLPRLSLYARFEVGAERTVVSNLKYSDDTILLIEVSENDIHNSRKTIDCFEKV